MRPYRSARRDVRPRSRPHLDAWRSWAVATRLPRGSVTARVFSDRFFLGPRTNGNMSGTATVVHDIDGSEARCWQPWVVRVAPARTAAPHDARESAQSAGTRREGMIRRSPRRQHSAHVPHGPGAGPLRDNVRFHGRGTQSPPAFQPVQKASRAEHDTNVYRATSAAKERLRGQGGRSARRLDSSSSATIRLPARSNEARRTATAGRTVRPKRWHAGAGNTRFAVRQWARSIRTRGSSTRTDMAR